MSEEKLRILDLFKEGKINAAETLELLESLNEIAGAAAGVQTETIAASPTDNAQPFNSAGNNNYHHLEVVLIGGGDITLTGWDGDDMVIDEPKSKSFFQKSLCKKTNDSYKIYALSGTDYQVKVPYNWDITIYTAGGDIRIREVSGRINGKTLGGDIWLSQVSGYLNLTTTGGDIKLQDSNADGNVHTLGGDVIFQNVTGNVEGTTLGGEMIRK